MKSQRFSQLEEIAPVFSGRSVAIVGSGPGVLDNPPGFVDSHDVVVRANNYKTSDAAGRRTDVHYSFFGTSIRKTREELQADGVRLIMCKCPDVKFLESEWHRQMNKPHGVDFRYIYENRRDWWFCDTYIPTLEDFLASFHLLGGHIPTTGFAAILAVLACRPASIYLTGFDFFASRMHNVNEAWKAGNPADPIGHVPEREREWVAANLHRGITTDPRLSNLMKG